MRERVFLDANILVSAAWRSDSGLLALWELPDVTLLTSAYAIVEADRTILMAAIESAANYLLTGDREHFGAYFDQTIEGVRVLRPAIYLKLRRQ